MNKEVVLRKLEDKGFILERKNLFSTAYSFAFKMELKLMCTIRVQ